MVKLSGGRIGPAEFRHCWIRWVVYVGLFAKRRAGRSRARMADYEALYVRLMEGCLLFQESRLGERDVDYRKLEEMIRPWVSLKSLARADRDILLHLVQQSRDVERQLKAQPEKIRFPF